MSIGATPTPSISSRLAEQGILGFLFFLLLIGVILTLALRMLKGETEKERLWLGLSISIALLTWLTLGLFHHIAYDLRSLEIFFWIFSAFLLVLARRTAEIFPTREKNCCRDAHRIDRRPGLPGETDYLLPAGRTFSSRFLSLGETKRTAAGSAGWANGPRRSFPKGREN